MCKHCSGEAYFRNVNIGKEIQQGQDWNELKGRKKIKKATVPWKKKLLVLDGFQVHPKFQIMEKI